MAESKESFIDSIARKHFPGIALNRLQKRMQYNAVTQWSGASKTSPGLTNFMPGVSDIDSSLLYERETLVDRSRDHVRNVPVAKALIDRICDHSIGEKGLMLHPKIDAKLLGMETEDAIKWQEQTAARWRLFAESKESDHYRRVNLNKKGYVTLQSQLEGGDCFTIFLDYERPGSPFTLKTQTLESEYINNKDSASNSETLYDGIVKNSNGVPVSVQISSSHPGDVSNFSNTEWSTRNFYSSNGNPLVLQHFNQIRPNQSRGVPILGTVTNKLLNLNKFSDSELLAAVINAYLTVILKGPKTGTQPNFKTAPGGPSSGGAPGGTEDQDKYKMGTGSFMRLDEDVDLTIVDPKRPSQLFSPFFQAMVAEIGAACGVPRSLVLMMFDKSYSASRGEVILAWMTFLKYRTMTAAGFYQPTYERFLDLEISKGIIPAPGYFENDMIKKAYRGSPYHQWSGPVREAIDEMKAANKDKLYNELRVKSKKQITEEISNADYETVEMQIQHEESLRKDAGVTDEDL